MIVLYIYFLAILDPNDYQYDELRIPPRPLTPRLPTIGEEFYDIGKKLIILITLLCMSYSKNCSGVHSQ